MGILHKKSGGLFQPRRRKISWAPGAEGRAGFAMKQRHLLFLLIL